MCVCEGGGGLGGRSPNEILNNSVNVHRSRGNHPCLVSENKCMM